MTGLLKKVYHKYSHTKIFEVIAKIYRNGFFLSNYMAYRRVKRISKKRNRAEGEIKVVFLCQNTQVWNKIKSVYEKMRDDNRYNAVILAVPGENSKDRMSIFNYFNELYPGEVINSFENDKWFDLKEYAPDYIFYQRPYDQYLPKPYRSKYVSRYSKICYVAYVYLVSDTVESICMEKLFFRNVYMYFAENTLYYNFNKKRFKLSHSKGYRKTFNIGYPSLENFMDEKECCEKKERFKIVWTPRWSEYKDIGGSNFMNFKDNIIDFAKQRNDVKIIFRPHPMTFQHFISVNRITEMEIEKYLECYKNKEELEYDDKADYAKTFWKSDALLTDISSVIVEYFLTGKPIIYCDTGSQPNKFMIKLLKVFYIANNWEEASNKMEELSKGIDPLKEKRLQKIEEVLGKKLWKNFRKILI